MQIWTQESTDTKSTTLIILDNLCDPSFNISLWCMSWRTHWLTLLSVHPKKYAHSFYFVPFWFNIWNMVPTNFTHIHLSYFTAAEKNTTEVNLKHVGKWIIVIDLWGTSFWWGMLPYVMRYWEISAIHLPMFFVKLTQCKWGNKNYTNLWPYCTNVQNSVLVKSDCY